MSPIGCVPTTAAALPLCTAKANLCLRRDGALRSPVRLATRPPISAHKTSADGPHVPRVSIAMGATMKSPDELISAYLISWGVSPFVAADPAASEDCLMCDGARVSG